MGNHLRRGLYGIYILIRRDIYEVYIEPFNIYINYYREILLFINNKRSIIHTNEIYNTININNKK